MPHAWVAMSIVLYLYVLLLCADTSTAQEIRKDASRNGKERKKKVVTAEVKLQKVGFAPRRRVE